MLASPGAARMTLEAALSTIAAVATSPCSPPAIVICTGGSPSIATEFAWVRSADIHLQLEVQHLATADKTARNLAHAGNLAGRDFHKLGADRSIGQHRRDRIIHLIELPAQPRGQHMQRFGQADVAHQATLDARLELGRRQSGTDFALERATPSGSINYAQHAHAAHSRAWRGQHQRQRIHRVAGVDTGAQQGDPRAASGGIELGRELRLRCPGVGQLLTGRDHVCAGFGDLFQLLGHLCER